MDLRDKPANFTAVYARALPDPTARAKVPVLELPDGEGVLCESLVICEYVDDLASPAFSPLDRATARLFAQLFPSWASFVPLVRAEEGSSDEADAASALLAGLRAADSFLREHSCGAGPFLLSDFSLAETATAPFAMRLLTVLPALRPSHAPLALVEEHGLQRLGEWLDAVRSRPSCAATLPPEETLVENYRRMLERMAAA